jgi:hypothetical protein
MRNILDTKYLNSFSDSARGLIVHYFDITLIDPDTTDNDLYKLETGVYGLVWNENIKLHSIIDNDGDTVTTPETHVLAMIDHCTRYAEEYL